MSESTWDYLWVALLGMLLGAAELISRYKDDPAAVLKSLPGVLYLALNGFAPIFALYVIHSFGWNFGISSKDNPNALRLTTVLVAGFGALALFRSSLFNVRIGTQDVGVGPSIVLQSLLNATDRAVDRHRGIERNRVISEVMTHISFEKAFESLPAYCIKLMQNLPDEDQRVLGEEVKNIRAGAQSDEVKAKLLGLALINLVGAEVVRDAVKELGQGIERVLPDEPIPIPAGLAIVSDGAPIEGRS